MPVGTRWHLREVSVSLLSRKFYCCQVTETQIKLSKTNKQNRVTRKHLLPAWLAPGDPVMLRNPSRPVSLTHYLSRFCTGLTGNRVSPPALTADLIVLFPQLFVLGGHVTIWNLSLMPEALTGIFLGLRDQLLGRHEFRTEREGLGRRPSG